MKDANEAVRYYRVSVQATELLMRMLESLGIRNDLPFNYEVSMPYPARPEGAFRLLVDALQQVGQASAEQMRERCAKWAYNSAYSRGDLLANQIRELPLTEESTP